MSMSEKEHMHALSTLLDAPECIAAYDRGANNPSKYTEFYGKLVGFEPRTPEALALVEEHHAQMLPNKSDVYKIMYICTLACCVALKDGVVIKGISVTDNTKLMEYIERL